MQVLQHLLVWLYGVLLAYSQMRGFVYGAPHSGWSAGSGASRTGWTPLWWITMQMIPSPSFVWLFRSCESLLGIFLDADEKVVEQVPTLPGTQANYSVMVSAGRRGQTRPLCMNTHADGGQIVFWGEKFRKIKAVVDIKVVGVSLWSLVSLAKMQSGKQGRGVF